MVDWNLNIFQVLCNTPWYITNQQMTIGDAASVRSSVVPVPEIFEMYQGFNDVKIEENQADATGC